PCRIATRAPRDSSSSATQRAIGVLPVPPTARLPTLTTAAPTRCDRRQPFAYNAFLAATASRYNTSAGASATLAPLHRAPSASPRHHRGTSVRRRPAGLPGCLANASKRVHLGRQAVQLFLERAAQGGELLLPCVPRHPHRRPVGHLDARKGARNQEAVPAAHPPRPAGRRRRRDQRQARELASHQHALLEPLARA